MAGLLRDMLRDQITGPLPNLRTVDLNWATVFGIWFLKRNNEVVATNKKPLQY
jgi:hypothetical protein